MLYSHIIHIQNNKDAMITTTQSFRKIYLWLYLKVLCVRGSWRLNRTATYWSPFLWPSAFLSRSPGLLNQRPSSAGCCFLYSILSPTGLVSKTQSGVSKAPSAGCWLSLPHLVSKLTVFLSSLSYIIVQSPTQYLPITGHRNMHFCVFGMACLAGSEVNIQQS